MIIAIDYDDTIVHADHPHAGEIKPHAAKVINKLYDDGHEIIIWTCRMEEYTVGEAKRLLAENGIKYHKFNEHMDRLIEQYKNDTRKIYADVYIDDKQLGGLPKSWKKIYKLLKKHHLK